MRLVRAEATLEGGPEMVEFGGGDYTRSTYSPNDPVVPVQVQENTNVGTGQYGGATSIPENDSSSAQMNLPFLFGQVSNSAPGYDFSGLFAREQTDAPTTIIERVVQWVRKILS